jgi:two-component system sensor histidine kinase FlrB
LLFWSQRQKLAAVDGICRQQAEAASQDATAMYSQQDAKTMNSVTEALASSSEQRRSPFPRQLFQSTGRSAPSLLPPDYFLTPQHAPEASSKLSSLLEILPNGVVILDENGVISEANPAAESLLGSGLTGVPWRQVIEHNFKPQADDGHEISLISGRRVSLTTRSLSHGRGQLIALNDLTETRNLQRKLAQHERLSTVGRMMASLAHQIRTPLSAALLQTENLRRVCESPRTASTADKVLSRLHNIERQIRDMLIYARGDAAPSEQMPAAELIEQIRQAALDLSLPEGIQLEWRNCVEGARLHCNADAVTGAVLNLLENAVQAAAKDSTVVLSSRLLGGDGDYADAQLLVTIDNAGDAIEEELLQQLSEPFVTTKSDGTGLGLSVVRLVARTHGGQFTLANRAQGGVRAQLRLPISELPTQQGEG